MPGMGTRPIMPHSPRTRCIVPSGSQRMARSVDNALPRRRGTVTPPSCPSRHAAMSAHRAKEIVEAPGGVVELRFGASPLLVDSDTNALADDAQSESPFAIAALVQPVSGHQPPSVAAL